MIAKANMNEFAAGVAGRNKHFGDAHNPWDLNRWPGGSSSGTGVSIAAGLCLGGLGTDTGVSVRGPAGWLGLVGVRPSYGRVSVRGIFPRAYSFDTVGPLAHTVADAGVRQFTVPVSFTGFPALSVPCGFDSSGLPIGLQIVANDFQEQLLFRIARALERESEFSSKRPSTYWQGAA